MGFSQTTPEINPTRALCRATRDGGLLSSQTATCETVNFVLTGHLEFSFSPVAFWFLSVAKVFGQKQNCERDPEMH